MYTNNLTAHLGALHIICVNLALISTVENEDKQKKDLETAQQSHQKELEQMKQTNQDSLEKRKKAEAVSSKDSKKI